jgi:hypothetical protein
MQTHPSHCKRHAIKFSLEFSAYYVFSLLQDQPIFSLSALECANFHGLPETGKESCKIRYGRVGIYLDSDVITVKTKERDNYV